MRSPVVIVDGYSTGKHLPEIFMEYGAKTIHVQSSPEIPGILQRSFNPKKFDIVLPYLPVDKISEQLRIYSPCVILAAAESGVLFADELNNLLGLNWSNPSMSLARRDKFKMIEALQIQGIPTAQQIMSTDPDAIALWSRSQVDWPVVLKPLMSTSSEDIYFCENENEIRKKDHNIIGKENYLGVRNDLVLAQSYLDGPIYVVDSVSLEGNHPVTDVWHFEFIINDHEHLNFIEHDLLSPDHPYFSELVDYNASALDAVGIQNDPSHSELKYTSRGVRLIETSARLMGATIEPSPIRSARGQTQVDWTVMAICAPHRFNSYFDRPYELKKYLAVIWVHFKKDGTIIDDTGCSLAEALPSYSCYVSKPAIGMKVSSSKDTTGRGGFIYLLNESQEQLLQDRQELIRIVDGQMLFGIDTGKSGEAY